MIQNIKIYGKREIVYMKYEIGYSTDCLPQVYYTIWEKNFN